MLQVIAAEGEQKVTILRKNHVLRGILLMDHFFSFLTLPTMIDPAINQHHDQASTALKEAASVIQQSPQALQVYTILTSLERWSIFCGDGMVMVIFSQRWNGDGF